MDRIERFLQIVGDMQWSDYLDIALVAYLIYLVLPLIRSNSTMRVARAVVAVVLIAWLTEVWSAQSRKGWDQIHAAGIGNLGCEILRIPCLTDKVQFVTQPLDDRAADKDGTLQRILHLAV